MVEDCNEHNIDRWLVHDEVGAWLYQDYIPGAELPVFIITGSSTEYSISPLLNCPIWFLRQTVGAKLLGKLMLRRRFFSSNRRSMLGLRRLESDRVVLGCITAAPYCARDARYPWNIRLSDYLQFLI